MNNWSGIGNIGNDPTFRTTGKGRSVLNFSIAIDRNTKANDEVIKVTDWFPIVVFGEQADHHIKYLQKGTKVAIVGTLRPRSYTDSTGAQHNTFEIQAEAIDWLANVRSPRVAVENSPS